MDRPKALSANERQSSESLTPNVDSVYTAHRTANASSGVKLDHSSAPEFLEYYEQESLSKTTVERFAAVQEKVLRLARASLGSDGPFDVVDIGCGAGTQCQLLGKAGHRVAGLDINEPLIKLAQRRAAEAGLQIDFRIGSATALPFEDQVADICLLPQLLEHVPDWETTVSEALRILRPGGVLYLSTTNVLCPKQDEFELPFFSWYPAVLKRRYERLSVTTRPELVNHTRYPAVHWFSVYQFKTWFRARGVEVFDRFDTMDPASLSQTVRIARRLILALPALRFVGHVLTPSCAICCVKATGFRLPG